MDTQLLNTQLEGLKAKLKDLRSKKSLFDKSQGLQEQEEKLKQEIQTAETEIQDLKEQISEKKALKAEAVKATAEALAKKMSILPEGRAYFDVEDGKVVLGLERNSRRTPYEGLSGGEKVSFDAALTDVLLKGENKVILIEAAEMDDDHLIKMLNEIGQNGNGAQFIVNTCHKPGEIPEGWGVVEL